MASKNANKGNTLSLALTLAASSLVAAGPCDIYASGNAPCIAAHSTTRALFDAYSGPLYQVKRGSDNTTADISPKSAGGVADAASQDTFCSGSTCLITTIYDQTSNGNHLTQGPKGAFSGPDVDGNDNLANPLGAPVTLNGEKAYGVFMSPGTGYRNNNVKGSATGDGSEGMYAIFDGEHYNDVCCFDYGNAETSTTDTGNGHMEALYFGNRHVTGSGAGDGPWIMADLENGLFVGSQPGNSQSIPSMTSRFVTAIVKGSPNQWSIRGGDAASGDLSTYFSGARPTTSGYNPMSLEGAIVLGIGGDNSNGGQGTFYEGVMTATYPDDDTENQVQANIVAAGYSGTALMSGPSLSVGSSVSFQATTAPCCTTKYLTHSGSDIKLQVVDSSSDATLKAQATWSVRTGLGNSDCLSFESNDTPGNYIRHASSVLVLSADDGSKLMHEDATFCPQDGISGKGSSIRSWSYPARYFRHYSGEGYLASNGGVHTFDNPTSYNDDATWIVGDGFV